MTLRRLKKAVEVRIRYLVGDPDLKRRPLDQLHTGRQFDRIYLEDGMWWIRWRSMKPVRDLVMKKYLGQ